VFDFDCKIGIAEAFLIALKGAHQVRRYEDRHCVGAPLVGALSQAVSDQWSPGFDT
jgi:hypothetical protein